MAGEEGVTCVDRPLCTKELSEEQISEALRPACPSPARWASTGPPWTGGPVGPTACR